MPHPSQTAIPEPVAPPPGDTGSPEEALIYTDHQDYDSDGWHAYYDCDDYNPSVYPGAHDYCDGTDQDCDGVAIPEGSCSEGADA